MAVLPFSFYQGCDMERKAVRNLFKDLTNRLEKDLIP